MNRIADYVSLVVVIVLMVAVESCNSHPAPKKTMENSGSSLSFVSLSDGMIEDRKTRFSAFSFGCILLDEEGRVTGALFMGGSGDIVASGTQKSIAIENGNARLVQF